MTDWKQLGAASALNIPADQAERITPILEALEKAFQPLVQQLPSDTQPAIQLFLPLP